MTPKLRYLVVISVLLASLASAGLTIAAAPLPQAGTPTQSPWSIVALSEGATVRSGPGTYYDRVGAMVNGQTAEVLGRSTDNAWLKIVYIGAPNNEGWVFRDNVRLVGDLPNMPTIVAPPTPTLPPTPTPPIDEILATDQPGSDPNAGRPPTFTPPAPQIQPTLLPAQGLNATSGFPPAVLIAVLFVLGAFGGVLSAFRARR